MAIRKRRKVRTPRRRPTGLPTATELAKALGHPVRVQALTILIDRISGPKEIAEQLDKPLSNVSYHVRELQKLGMIEIVEEEAVRGSVAHFFKATEPETTKAFLGHFQTAVRVENLREDA